MIHEVKDIPGLGVTRDGKIWSCRIRGQRFPERRGPWKEVATYRRPYGCRYMVFCYRPESGGPVQCFYVHRIVLEAFKGPSPDGMEARHKDGDTSNNHIDNLEWGTHAENMEDKRRHGRGSEGTKNGNAKITDGDVREIRRSYKEDGVYQKVIAKKFGLKQTTVSRIVLGKSWKHVG
jgi:hypothetical protein